MERGKWLWNLQDRIHAGHRLSNGILYTLTVGHSDCCSLGKGILCMNLAIKSLGTVHRTESRIKASIITA